jgi:hypothetical protein
MKKTILFGVLITAVLFSCKKKDNNCEASTASITGKYKISSVKYKQTSSSPEVDGSSLIYSDDCEKDDVFEFAANGIFNYIDAGVICSSNGSYSDTWSYSSSNLSFDGDSYPIESFSCNSMVISASNTFVSGDKLTVTFAKQ